MGPGFYYMSQGGSGPTDLPHSTILQSPCDHGDSSALYTLWIYFAYLLQATPFKSHPRMPIASISAPFGKSMRVPDGLLNAGGDVVLGVGVGVSVGGFGKLGGKQRLL